MDFFRNRIVAWSVCALLIALSVVMGLGGKTEAQAAGPATSQSQQQ